MATPEEFTTYAKCLSKIDRYIDSKDCSAALFKKELDRQDKELKSRQASMEAAMREIEQAQVKMDEAFSMLEQAQTEEARVAAMEKRETAKVAVQQP